MNSVKEINIIKPKNQLIIYGFEDYFNFFINLYKNSKLPNVILLNGPKGLGKATFVYHFVNYLLSNNESYKYSLEKFEINPVNKSYKLLTNGIHPNFFFIRQFAIFRKYKN